MICDWVSHEKVIKPKTLTLVTFDSGNKGAWTRIRKYPKAGKFIGKRPTSLYDKPVCRSAAKD